MNFSTIPILSTAISVVIAWALFSLLCSYVHEAFVQMKAERGRFLKECLLRQFQDLPNGVNWASRLYLNGAINLLSKDYNKPTSEISPQIFAKTLIEVVEESHIVQIHLERETGNFKHYKNSTLRNFKAATEHLNPSDVLNLFQQCLKDAEAKSNFGTYVYLESDFKRIDESIIYLELTKNLETWFTDFVTVVSTWYKKKTRKRLFILGVVLGTILNVDSIQLFRHFNADETSRNELVSYYVNHKAELEEEALKIKASENINAPELTKINSKISSLTKQLDSLSKTAVLPVGLKESVFKNVKRDLSTSEDAFFKIAGLLLTGFAISFGAPFWFDVLKKIFTLKK